RHALLRGADDLDALAPGRSGRRAPHDRRRPAPHAGASVAGAPAHRRAVAAPSGHATLILEQDGEPVRTEGLVRGTLADRSWRDELAAHDLLRLQAEGPVVADAVDHPVHVGVLVGPAEREELVEGGLYAQLLGQFARGAGRELLSGQQHA